MAQDSRRAIARHRSFSCQHDPMTSTGSPVPHRAANGTSRCPEGRSGVPRDWMAYGACHGADTELFFPIATAGRALEQVNAAKVVCGRCEVRADCLSYTLTTMQHGIWGEQRGTSAPRCAPSAAEC
jgi:WhiB family redox-sensing transcriptional regulator